MAALFSTVTLTAKSERLSFLVSGFPSDVCFLRGIPVFEDFMFRTVGQDVDIYIIAFLYGDGDIACLFYQSFNMPIISLIQKIKAAGYSHPTAF